MNTAKDGIQPLGEMLPQDSSNDVTDDGLVDSETTGNGLLRLVWIHLANRSHVIVSQLGAAMNYAKRVTTFGTFVFVVVLNGSDKQMVRVYTWRVVAAMKDVFAWWNRPIDALIRNPMRTVLAALLVANDAVSSMVNRSLPRPTGTGFAWNEVTHETIT